MIGAVGWVATREAYGTQQKGKISKSSSLARYTREKKSEGAGIVFSSHQLLLVLLVQV